MDERDIGEVKAVLKSAKQWIDMHPPHHLHKEILLVDLERAMVILEDAENEREKDKERGDLS